MSTKQDSRRYSLKGQRHGIAAILIIVALIVIIAVAAVSVYYFALSPSPSASVMSQSTTSQTSTGQTSTSQTSTVGTSTTSSRSSQSTTTGSSGIMTYSGTFNYTNPEGPGGERVFSNDTVQTYGSIQFASGSFTFSINPQNYSGTGSGHGTLSVTTTGFCSGKVTLSYAFSIQATQLPGQNITLGFGTPTPVNATVPLTCTGPLNGINTATNNPVPYLSEYPGLITTATIPVTVSENLGAGITYFFTIARTS